MKILFEINKYLLLVCAAIIFTFCRQDSIEINNLNTPNPTSYEFSAPLNEISEKILKSFGDLYTLNPEVWGDVSPDEAEFTVSAVLSVETAEGKSIFSKDIFSNAAFVNDIYLHSFHNPISLSPVYFKNNKPLKYIADFQIHFEELSDKNKTKIIILTRNSQVITGATSGFLNTHGPANIYKDVAPTSIEEYRLLKIIGEIIGEKNMPELKLPK